MSQRTFSCPLPVWPPISLLALGRKEKTALTHYPPHLPTKMVVKEEELHELGDRVHERKGVEARDAVRHLIVHRTVPVTNNYLLQYQ